MMFLPLSKKVEIWPDTLPYGCRYMESVIDGCWQKNRFKYKSNNNVIRILMNTDNIQEIEDVSDYDFVNNKYLYWYYGSNSKLTLKDDSEIYVTEPITDIYSLLQKS